MDIVLSLQELGLREYEARAYLALLQGPGATGYEVAKRSGVPRAKVYETLEALQAKGTAYTTQEGDQVRYHPVPHHTLLERHRERAERTAAELGPLLDRYAVPGVEAPLVTIRGYDAILMRAEEVIRAAERRVFISGFPTELQRLVPALQAAVSRGALVFPILYGEGDLGLPRLFLHEVPDSVGMGRGALHYPPLVVVADQQEALMAEMAPGARAVGLWTANPGVTLVAGEFIRHDIYLAELNRRFGAELADQKGRMSDLQAMWTGLGGGRDE